MKIKVGRPRANDSGPRTIPIQLRFNQEEWDRLEVRSAEREMTPGQYARLALEELQRRDELGLVNVEVEGYRAILEKPQLLKLLDDLRKQVQAIPAK